MKLFHTLRMAVRKGLFENAYAQSTGIEQPETDKSGWGESHQARFDRAIYLSYVERQIDNELKRVTKEEFYEKVFNSNLGRRITTHFDKSNIYRLADEKEIWINKHGNTLGEVWREEGVESYWLNRRLKDVALDKNVIALPEIGWYAKKHIHGSGTRAMWEIFSVDTDGYFAHLSMQNTANPDAPSYLFITDNKTGGLLEKLEWDSGDILNAIRYVFLRNLK